jgi:hypothetical protein
LALGDCHLSGTCSALSRGSRRWIAHRHDGYKDIAYVSLTIGGTVTVLLKIGMGPSAPNTGARRWWAKMLERGGDQCLAVAFSRRSSSPS